MKYIQENHRVQLVMRYSSGILFIFKDYGLLFALCSLKNIVHQHQFILLLSKPFIPAHCGSRCFLFERTLPREKGEKYLHL
jgi:hypothetical protein